MKKVIVCTDAVGNETTYDTVTEAANAVSGGWSLPIKRCLKGKQPTAFGMRWKYRKEVSNETSVSG